LGLGVRGSEDPRIRKTVHRAPSRAGASNLLARHQVDRLWVTDVASVFAGIEELNAAITEAPTSGDPARRAEVKGLWGASTPSRRLTCDVLSQPTLAYRTRAHYHRGPRASPKGTREDYHGSMNGQYTGP
jgi:hypothetical protein